jgi:transposase
VDGHGVPLLVLTTPANVRDEKPLLEMLELLPAIQGRRGRPRRRIGTLYGDRGYGFPSIIREVRARGIRPRLAPRWTPEHGSGLGRKRYVVEQTLACLGHCRRLKLCYEKTGPHFQAFHEIAEGLFCFGRLQQVTRPL